MMTRPWKLRTQFRKREVEIGVPNFQKIMDNTFITDQNLRSINKQIVDRKEELSELFSALGEIEVLLAVADCYRDNKNTWPISFPDKVLDVDDETELVINDARPPLIAVKDPRGTIANNIRLGNRKNDYAFTMIMGNVGGGRTSFQRTAAQNQALAQNGFFWFASGGYFAAGIVMTSMDLTTNLGSRNYPEYEASRTALALRMANIYPHSYYYADDPFTGGGEIAGINARAATLRGFMHRRTVGMLATRSLGLYLEVKDIDGIEKLYAENRVIGPFKPKEHMQGLRPDDYYNRLADYGMPADVMEDMRLNYKRLADRHLKGALDKPDDQ